MASIDKGFMKLIFITTKNNNQTEKFQQLIRDCIQVLDKDVNSQVTARVEFEEPVQVGTENEFCRIDCNVSVTGQPLYVYFSQVSRLFADRMKVFAEKNASDDLQFRTSVQIQDRNFFDIGKL